jgi:hypothetical protein
VGWHFLAWLIGATLTTLAALGCVGMAVTTFSIKPPPERFTTSYFEFDLAPGWRCDAEGKAYTCEDGREPATALVVIAMKFRNQRDNIDSFESFLKTPKVITLEDGTATPSQVNYVRRRSLGHHVWVESLHLGSEVQTYYTYYLATRTAQLAILVSMSVHKDYVSEYIHELEGMISTLYIYQRQ